MKQVKIRWIYWMNILLPFLGIILLQLVVRVNAIKNNYQIYSVIFIILMLLLIIASYLPIKKRVTHMKSNFHIPMMSCWILMCLFMLYSDITIPKNYGYLSLIYMFLFTGLFFVWQQYDSKRRDNLFSILLLSIEMAFIFATIFCFLFRPYTPGIRYSGLSANPNVYGMFLVTVWACLLTKFDNCIGQSEHVKHCLFISIEFGVALFFLYMTGARTSFLSIALISFVWFCMRLYFSRKKKAPILRYIFTAICGVLISFFVSYGILALLPNAINHPVVFERDRLFTSIYQDETICLAKNPFQDIKTEVESEPSPVKRLLDAFKDGSSLDVILNGRLSIYKSYINKLNYKGHKRFGKKVDGLYVVNAHNNVIQIAFTYGILAAIPYVLICIFSFLRSIQYYRKFHDTKKNACFPMLITTAFLLTSLTECILIPMQSLLAFAFFISLGELMNTKQKQRT